MITTFNNIKDIDNPFFENIDDVLNSIKNGYKLELIESIRSCTDKEKRNSLKRQLKSICFSGEFSKRNAVNCIKHSGFVCLDFDNMEGVSPSELRSSLRSDEYIYSAFISPSGNGVKAIIKIPPVIQDHKKYYEAIWDNYNNGFLDKSTKDICRVCYYSYDPELFINHNSKTWVLKKEYKEVRQNNEYPSYFLIEDVNKKVDVILKWFNKKFTLNVGERNNNLYKLAISLNEAGLSKSDAISLFHNFYSSGLKKGEIDSIIDSGYKDQGKFNTLVLADENKIAEAERIIKNGNSKAKKEFTKKGLTDSEIDDILEYDFEDDFLQFWDIGKNGAITLNDYKFKIFLENRGYNKVQLNEREFTFVKVYNNKIKEVNETQIKDFVLSHVIEIDVRVYNFFAKSVNKFASQYLTLLATKELVMLNDTGEKSYLFFRNKVVVVTVDEVSYIDYRDLDGYVWEKNIIQRDFELTSTPTDFEKFIANVTNQDERRKKVLDCVLGYMVNAYKKQDEGVAVILYDETLNDNPSGRTGKTLISKALSCVRKLITLNGKEFDSKGNFPYDVVNLNDNIICFDDMERTFKFESLFSIITGGLTLKKKFLQPIEIPFERSPKIMFTSNYVLSGTGDSHEARKIEIELYRHYSNDYKPVDEFGKLFFTEWDKSEWNAFFSYMIRCLQAYFTNGLLKSELTTGKSKKLIANTCEDFYDFCENEFNWINGQFYTTKEIMNAYNNGDRELPSRMNMKWFGRWIGMYISYKDWKREDSTSGGVRKFAITGAEEKQYDNDLF